MNKVKNSKPKILLSIGAFLPGFKAGGPIPSVSNLVARLSDEFDFRILTADRDLGDTEPYLDVPTDRWIAGFGGQVRYCSPAKQGLRAMAATIRETPHDLLYLNSFFSTRFSVSPLLSRRFGMLPAVPTVLAPRGEFSSGALALKSGKKRTYIQVGNAMGLFKGLQWHASTTHELADIHAAMDVSDKQVSIASDLPALLPEAPLSHAPRKPNSPLRVTFISRISPMKNLDFALQVLSEVDFPVQFTIVGPEEDKSYSERCRALANALPANVQVKWAGAAPPEQIPQAMADHDLFFLPTHGENFGHVIAEALGAGTPVLLSDTTPWRGLEDLGIGHDLPLAQPELFRKALYDAWHQSETQAGQRRARAASYARKRQRNSADVEANRALFCSALETPTCPSGKTT